MLTQANIKNNQNMGKNNVHMLTRDLIISDKEFNLFKSLIYDKAGITLASNKRTLVVSRLSKRMRQLQISSFAEYYGLVTRKNNSGELQKTIDFLTTNETYFFREEKHFDYLKSSILNKKSSSSDFKIWSAASSTGEEAYSIAMVLAEKYGLRGSWKILGTDINSDVVKQAKRGLYPLIVSEKILRSYLREYCLKGVREQTGMMLMNDRLKNHVDFELLNINADWPGHINDFDVVFLRNIMIYFDLETKQRLVNKIADKIKMGGYLFIGHSETLNKVSDRFKIIQPSICKKIK
ncbi:MAG: chemotaxis protein CheR [Gammaproteobacteria bacterium]|nr:MAG: chemotaxis protein CheR [Gammaproteobacteria bacterium]